MIEVVGIGNLRKGDIILINGFEDNGVNVVTVERVTRDGLIIPRELGGLDYCPEDSSEIVRIGSADVAPVVVLQASGMVLMINERSFPRNKERVVRA